ncbi:MAG: SEC-C domain-containing protein, partial [Clostridia bacterium]|nr:SEC-C domain-containing protein [Clostridia bacterium]
RTFGELNAKYKEQIKEEADVVRAAGGLFIIGTERHESRRIDNQLRGRAGRQGDPGESRFYLSMEDDLMRLFGGERMYAMMEMLRVDENTPIENKMLTHAIENAQQRVEERNFGIRRDVLQYDDVMNRQREIIYGQRDKVLDGEDLGESVVGMIRESIEQNVALYTTGEEREEWNLGGLREYYLGWLTKEEDFRYTAQELEDLERESLTELITDRAMEMYNAKEAQYGEKIMRELERVVLLRTVDRYWMDHIDNMDELRRGIHLRSYAQKDPVVAYRLEGFDMFDQMVASIREDTARATLLAQIRTQEEPKRVQVAKETGTSGDGTAAARTVRKTAAQKVGRNDPCPCGSGKKYKKCCGAGSGD